MPGRTEEENKRINKDIGKRLIQIALSEGEIQTYTDSVNGNRLVYGVPQRIGVLDSVVLRHLDHLVDRGFLQRRENEYGTVYETPKVSTRKILREITNTLYKKARRLIRP